MQQARSGRFAGSEIPVDLRRQWIQGTGPGAKPGATVPQSIRNVAHALLSGADGWMFDGEDALGQLSTMSLDNQRNLKLAIAGDPVFLQAAETVAGEMNAWGEQFFGHPIVAVVARAAAIHHEDFPSARPAPRRSADPSRGRRRIFRVDRRRRAVCRQQRARTGDALAHRSFSTCRKFRRPKRLRSGARCSTGWRRSKD